VKKILLKNLYSIYLTLYILWWVSVFIIISDEGFNPLKDIPWFILFTLILTFLWVIKFKFTNDNSIIFHKDMTTNNKIIHLSTIILMTIFMLFFS